MSNKPELIVFSQNLLGGGASFHRNMLAHFPKDFFDIKCIYVNPTNWHGAKALDIVLGANDTIFSYGDDSVKITAKKLGELIPNTPGAAITNLETELISLDLYRKPAKTVYFICHDDGFIHLAVKYETIIDVFIAHNIAVYDALVKLLSNRKGQIYFIQHGVGVPSFERSHHQSQNLKIVFLARHHAFKGIYDLPLINDLLAEKNIQVEWTILGDGPERANLIDKTKQYANFSFAIPKTASDVLTVLKEQDVFILPSRADGLPVALLESMSVGCVPVIANFSEGIKKVVTEQIGFVLPVGDNPSFAEKISLLAVNRDLLKQLSDNCITKVKKEFDIEKQALEYYNLYKQYQLFHRKHLLGLTAIGRRLGAGKYFNKMAYMLKAVQGKLRGRKTF